MKQGRPTDHTQQCTGTATHSIQRRPKGAMRNTIRPAFALKYKEKRKTRNFEKKTHHHHLAASEQGGVGNPGSRNPLGCSAAVTKRIIHAEGVRFVQGESLVSYACFLVSIPGRSVTCTYYPGTRSYVCCVSYTVSSIRVSNLNAITFSRLYTDGWHPCTHDA